MLNYRLNLQLHFGPISFMNLTHNFSTNRTLEERMSWRCFQGKTAGDIFGL
jgi:hypothetical protein